MLNIILKPCKISKSDTFSCYYWICEIAYKTYKN